jgi:PleD family two-component response regulator
MASKSSQYHFGKALAEDLIHSVIGVWVELSACIFKPYNHKPYQAENLPNMKRKKIRMAIAEDHQTVIDGLLSLLHKHEYFKAVIITTTPQELLRQMACTPVDILFADITMLYRNGHELANKVKELFPGVKMVALFEKGQNNIVNTMIEEGTIGGFVLKSTDKQTLTKATQTIKR